MKYVLANWKMYLTVDEARNLLGTVQAGLCDRAGSGAVMPRVILCPPAVSLVPLRAIADHRLVHLGAQDCHWEHEGPYTGETSPQMLQGLVDYVMVGHSERRAAGESDEQIAKKVRAVADAGFVPILFVGEDARDEDPTGQTEHRLRRGLADVDPELQSLIVVYEPRWAIGADRAAPAEHVGELAGHVKAVLAELGATDPVVIYGGSVAEQSIDDFLALEALDGVGASRASLEAESFLKLVDRVAAAQ